MLWLRNHGKIIVLSSQLATRKNLFALKTKISSSKSHAVEVLALNKLNRSREAMRVENLRERLIENMSRQLPEMEVLREKKKEEQLAMYVEELPSKITPGKREKVKV